MINKQVAKVIGFTMLIAVSTSSYAANTFTCPSPQEIQSTDFTAPSIWIAPPVVHSVPNQAGIGLGGKVAKKLLGVEKARINGREGWICVYQSEGGTAANDYQAKVREVVSGNKFLAKYLDKVNEAIEKTQPYLENYPKDQPLGVIGYQLETQNVKK